MVAVWKRKPKVPVVIGGIYKKVEWDGDRFYLMTRWSFGSQARYGLMGFHTGTSYGGCTWELPDMEQVISDFFELVYDPTDSKTVLQMTLEYVEQGGQND